tara:strand:+ start:121 stop:540 length:420 start_codon:yes stop_codon:yes gene_type:complete
MNKIQVGYDSIEKKRDIGEIWTDVNGVRWKQKDGYAEKIIKNPGVGFDKCSDCGKLIVGILNKNTFIRMGRCYHCQLNFEVDLKEKGVWKEWVAEQENKRWKSVMDEVKSFIGVDNPFDKTVANALANENLKSAAENNK